jgi:hypothetical protein
MIGTSEPGGEIMNQDEYKQILIIDIKQRGYRWETIRTKGGGEKRLDEASVNQLLAIRNNIRARNESRLLRKVKRSLSKEKQLEFEF